MRYMMNFPMVVKLSGISAVRSASLMPKREMLLGNIRNALLFWGRSSVMEHLYITSLSLRMQEQLCGHCTSQIVVGAESTSLRSQ